MSVTASQRMGGRVAMQRTANPRTWVQIPACAPIKLLQRMLFISIPYRNEARYFQFQKYQKQFESRILHTSVLL